jgi:N-acetylneuraminic acid mutarotase
MKKHFLKIASTLFFILISLNGFSFWKWTKLQSLGNGKRYEATSFSINNKGYITCGLDTNDNCYNDLWEYDPAFNFWTQKANLPATFRRASFGFELGGNGYVGGGIDNAVSSIGTILNEFWMYDPILNTWASKASTPITAFRSVGVSCNGKGYMVGGANNWSLYTNVYEYNPSSNTWLAKAAFPGVPTSSGGRESGTACSVNNKVYFGLGKDDSFFQNDWWEYNPTANTWLRKADFPASGRTGAWSFAINGMPVVGMGSDGSFASDTWQYDIATNTWNYTCAFNGGGRRSVAAFAIGNVGYMGTGKSGGGTKQDFYKLDADVSVSELLANSNLLAIYPNPVIGNVFSLELEVELNNASYSILNSEGKVMVTEPFLTSTKTIQRNNLSAGIYFITIQNKNQLLATKKIILL